MTTQVDWWQIKNAPPLGQTVLDDYPISTGPYTVPILLINNEGGLRVDDFQAVNTIRASLTQQGVIGTIGFQQIVGPLIGCADNTSGPPPLSWGGGAGIICQDSTLAFYSSSEGATSGPGFFLGWSPGTTSNRGGIVHSDLSLILEGGSTLGYCLMQNVGTGDYVTCDGVTRSVGIEGTNAVTLIAGGSMALANLLPSSGGYDALFDVSTGLATTAAFSVNGSPGATAVGAFGGDFEGGILITPGPNTIPWSAITGTPTTFSGYGLPTPIAAGDPAGGDLTGTYPNPGVGQIQGFPLAISGPVSGDVLTWGGLSWVAAPGGGGGGLAIGNPVGGGAGNRVLLEDAGANLADSPQVVWDATNGMYVNDGATCSSRLAQFGVAASFDDGINNARMCDGTWAMQVTSGAIKLAGGTVDFPNSHIPPTTTQAVPAPASAYGQGTINNYLGDPDQWVQVTLGGVQYVLPLYLP